MDKPAPEHVAVETFNALGEGNTEVFPDDFSKQMYATFLKGPEQLLKVFTDMS